MSDENQTPAETPKPEKPGRSRRVEVVNNSELWVIELRSDGSLCGHIKRMRSSVTLTSDENIARLRQAKDGQLLVCRSSNSEREVDRLAGYLLRTWPAEIGAVQLRGGESAVEVSIRLLEKHRCAAE